MPCYNEPDKTAAGISERTRAATSAFNPTRSESAVTSLSNEKTDVRLA